VSANGPEPENNDAEELVPNSAADDFFVKIKHDFRRPKPSEEAVASALQAIQNVIKGTALESGASSEVPRGAGEACPKCAAVNTESNRFCGYCGALLARNDKPKLISENQSISIATQPPPAVVQHIYHHHHHHFSAAEDGSGEPRVWTSEKVTSQPPQASEGIDAESAIHNLVRNWSLYFNAKRLDDLTKLYSRDAIVLRPNVPPAQGTAALRQLLIASMEAGLGDVDLENGDIGIVGDFACLTGRSKMLTPLAAKRHEETGKYLIVARRHAGEWQIVADSWCMDSKAPVSIPGAPVLPMRAMR
jgi:ketosteroid isomerase-like protein